MIRPAPTATAVKALRQIGLWPESCPYALSSNNVVKHYAALKAKSFQANRG
jgi:hypothetical protein